MKSAAFIRELKCHIKVNVLDAKPTTSLIYMLNIPVEG
ncbi:hypothetical protein NT6N_04630 [Oceaniferula spumae]|uniref:Uncharacterized protein n=1 Tax=Oceaniferula spumae TaxID=2979115 RepID=A0AAT9FHG8_9BACT